jgi:hypothetical protein
MRLRLGWQWLAAVRAAAVLSVIVICAGTPAASPTVTEESLTPAVVPIFDPSHPDALPSPRSNVGWQAPAPVPLPPTPVPSVTSLRGDASTLAAVRTAAAIRPELVRALQGHDSAAAARLLTEAAGLGELPAAGLLYEALDAAHGPKFRNRRGRHAGLGPTEVEGYSSIAEQKSLRRAFHHSDIKTICETGFNAGHSAANYLLANYFGYDVSYVGFDLGRTPYSKAAEGFLKTLFPDKFQVNWGDSRDTLPSYLSEHPGLICDGIMVDGGHNYETSKADLRAFLTRARCGSRVAIDDIEMPALRRSWKEAQDDGLLREDACETARDPDATRNWCA